jgi:hypothetical protein
VKSSLPVSLLRSYSDPVPPVDFRRGFRALAAALGACVCTAAVASCAAAGPSRAGAHASHVSAQPAKQRAAASPALPPPVPLAPFTSSPAGQGLWRAAGRPVRGFRVVYETTLVPPGGSQPAGIAWMDTRLLAARLYSGSISPGGGPYRFKAPIQPAQAATLIAAFNGGFKMKGAHGGYYTEGRMIDPLRTGAASLVIYADGSVGLGAWGSDVQMTPLVVSVRQNLVPLVADGRPTAAAEGDWHAWGPTCGAYSCAVPGIPNQWRSGLGITADGGLVYVVGPALDPLQLASLLIRAGAERAMQLDINPEWPTFVAYDPTQPGGLASPTNGQRLLASTVQGPATFFAPSWGRDFITMSALPAGSAQPTASTQPTP